jgi:hypothetical protein
LFRVNRNHNHDHLRSGGLPLIWYLATAVSQYILTRYFRSADISAGEPRPMIIGLQSLALLGADLAGMTPANYIMDVISRAVPKDADLTLGPPAK